VKLLWKTLKDISDFKCKRTFLRKRTARRHNSNHLALEMKTFFGTLHQRWTQHRFQCSKSGLPTDCHQRQHRERERKKHAHNTETKNTKLERLRSARLIRRDSKTINSRHAKAASEITDSSLLATIINHFKHYYYPS
jgi:hypothetical protein